MLSGGKDLNSGMREAELEPRRDHAYLEWSRVMEQLVKVQPGSQQDARQAEPGGQRQEPGPPDRRDQATIPDPDGGLLQLWAQDVLLAHGSGQTAGAP